MRSSLFGNLPYGMKVLGANIWGYYLKWWRYGQETPELVAGFLEHDHWSLDKILPYQSEKIAKMLNYAATKIPYYQYYWINRKRNGDRASWEILDNWPILHKEVVRQQPQAFKSPDARFLFSEHSSGSTGTPLTLYQGRKTLHYWYALHEARVHNWNGLTRTDRWAILGGQIVTSVSRNTPPFWVWNQAFNQLYLSTYHIKKSNLSAYVDALRKYKVKYLLGYPSSLTSLAEFICEQGLEMTILQCVICNAEPLYDFQRQLISKAFNCPVVNTYGMSELVCGASECSNKTMHIWPEAGVIEILDDKEDKILPNHTIGRIIATGLLNFDMPLIRYETGDRGSLSNQKCVCGRSFTSFENIEGRIDDVIITPDGRLIGRLDPVFKTGIPIREAQIIQETIDEIKLRYVPADNYHHDDIVRKLLRERLGNMKIVLEPVTTIPRGPNGKFKAVISKINK